MWRYSAPDWPHGVQEDDDAHWSWAPSPAGGEADDDLAGRLPAMDTGLLPLRYEVRSADRARS
jgi:hypothetical protein